MLPMHSDTQTLNALLRKTYYLLVCMIATARALLSWQVFFLTFLGEPIRAKPQLFPS